MNDLDKSSQADHQQAVKDWWISLKTKEKWTGATYQDNWETHLHYWIRQKKTLEFIDNCNLPKDAKILELGFGGSETALKILDKGYTYYGMDISKLIICVTYKPGTQYCTTVMTLVGEFQKIMQKKHVILM